MKIIKFPYQLLATIMFAPMLVIWAIYEVATGSSERLWLEFLEDIWW